MEYISKFVEVFKALEEEKVEYILIGGLAVIIYGLPRITQDIDLFINPNQDNIDKFKKALSSVFSDGSIDEINADELKSYSVIRYGTPEDFYIDIISRIGEIATYSDLRYELVDYEGVTIRIATPESLYNLKINTLRFEDKRDALFLKDLIENRKNKT